MSAARWGETKGGARRHETRQSVCAGHLRRVATPPFARSWLVGCPSYLHVLVQAVEVLVVQDPSLHAWAGCGRRLDHQRLLDLRHLRARERALGPHPRPSAQRRRHAPCTVCLGFVWSEELASREMPPPFETSQIFDQAAQFNTLPISAQNRGHSPLNHQPTSNVWSASPLWATCPNESVRLEGVICCLTPSRAT